jgi:ABC-2 type transport system ATP-binding protein
VKILIQVDNVTKRYGQQKALDGISFTVDEGEIVGFLGPNGAGKTTTMNIITGYISATEGSVKVDGKDILESPREVKKMIGYLPEIPPLYMDMTVEEYLTFASRIKKVPSAKMEESLDRIMELVKVDEVRGRLIKNLSKGYRQRVGLAQAIVGDPRVLILDEPTVGLDPKQIIEIRNVIKELGKNRTILLSSHILPEVSAICDRVIIINRGSIVASGTPDELSKQFGYSNRLILRVKGNSKEVLAAINRAESVSSVKELGIREVGTIDVLAEAKKGRDIREPLFNALSEARMPIFMMKSNDLTLEEVFLQVTETGKEEHEDAERI